MNHRRFGGMEFRLSLTSEPLPTFIANQGSRLFSWFQLRWLGCRIIFIRSWRFDFIKSFVLVCFEPFESSLHCMLVSPTYVSYFYGRHLKMKNQYSQPPDFFTAISALSLSKPMSKRTSRSEEVILINVNIYTVPRLELQLITVAIFDWSRSNVVGTFMIHALTITSSSRDAVNAISEKESNNNQY